MTLAPDVDVEADVRTQGFAALLCALHPVQAEHRVDAAHGRPSGTRRVHYGFLAYSRPVSICRDFVCGSSALLSACVVGRPTDALAFPIVVVTYIFTLTQNLGVKWQREGLLPTTELASYLWAAGPSVYSLAGVVAAGKLPR